MGNYRFFPHCHSPQLNNQVQAFLNFYPIFLPFSTTKLSCYTRFLHPRFSLFVPKLTVLIEDCLYELDKISQNSTIA